MYLKNKTNCFFNFKVFFFVFHTQKKTNKITVGSKQTPPGVWCTTSLPSGRMVKIKSRKYTTVTKLFDISLKPNFIRQNKNNYSFILFVGSFFFTEY